MRLPLISALLIVGAVSLSACATATPLQVPLAQAARDNIASSEIVAPIKQNEIYVFVPASTVATAAGGGLLAALVDAGIDAARTHSAEEAVKPLRDAVVDYNFDETLRIDLETTVSQIDWMHLSGTRVIKDTQPPAIASAITGSKDAAVLLATSDYHLSNDASELTITLAADMFPNSASLKALKTGRAGKTASDPANAVYRNNFSYTAKVPGTAGDRAANITAWSADNGAALRKALNDGASELANRLANDLQSKQAAAASATQLADAAK
jgi:hypothetical protein